MILVIMVRKLHRLALKIAFWFPCFMLVLCCFVVFNRTDKDFEEHLDSPTELFDNPTTENLPSRHQLSWSEMCRTAKDEIGEEISRLSDEQVKSVSRADFFRLVMKPLEYGCKAMQRFGGVWYGFRTNCYDGSKMVCMDDLIFSNEPCIVYSFGINQDISFENVFSKMGCTVHAYDHTISQQMLEQSRPEDDFWIHKVGIGAEDKDNLVKMSTAMTQNGHANATITYLKADIEGAELQVLPNLIESGVLNQVQQFAFEFHTSPQTLSQYLRIVRDLYRLGFRIISWDPNLCVGEEDGYQRYFEVVFRRKSDKDCQF